MLMQIIYPLTIKTLTEPGSAYSDYKTISPYQAEAYLDEIRSAIVEENKRFETPRGLAEYMDDGALKDKVLRLYPAVKVIDEELWGVTVAKISEALSDDEVEQLLDFVREQNSDGYGEGFEQRPIDTADGEIYVSFWNSSDSHSLRVELA